MGPALVYLGLGSNLGDRLEQLRFAARELQRSSECPIRKSPVYETEPVGYLDQPDFLNAVVSLETSLPPRELLETLQRIETAAGRVRSFPNAPRPLDIDILLYGNLKFREPGLEIPHPRLLERSFVVVPLLDLDPDVRFAGGVTISSLVAPGLAVGLEPVMRSW